MHKSILFSPRFIRLLVLGTALLTVFPVTFFAQNEFSTEEVFYSLSEHLYGADASIIVKGKEVIGKWVEESFLFKGYSRDAAVQLVEVTLDEQTHKAITLNPVSPGFRRLRFTEVPPASKLNLFYKVDQLAAGSQPIYLYFKVLIGSHELKRVRISSQDKDWKKISLDLGIVAFFRQDVVLTFELMSDSDQAEFSFFGDIQP